MSSFEFVSLERFRVQLPTPLYPYKGKQHIIVCDASDSTDERHGWVRFAKLSEYFPSPFVERNWLNVPGSVFGAETDTCTTGPHEAPQNVLLDCNGQEFLFRQPSTPSQLRDVISAAICECFEGYGATGDLHWRLGLIREWWSTRADMLGIRRGR